LTEATECFERRNFQRQRTQNIHTVSCRFVCALRTLCASSLTPAIACNKLVREPSSSSHLKLDEPSL
jgi:hypothetical protein